MPTQRQTFIEQWPLFAKCDCPDFYPPDNISRTCPICEKETTWNIDTRGESYPAFKVSGYFASYECGLCKQSRVAVLIRIIKRTQETPTKVLQVQKIGQFPPPSIDIVRDLEKRLGEDAALYKNALVCRSQGFGIGALAYMRRVVENKTNELIEVIALQAASFGVAPGDIAKIRAVVEEKITYDQRLRLASEAIPSTLKPDGANPLAALYELLSRGLHAENEDECLAIADEIREVFEYVFSRLRAEIEDRNSVVAKIKKWVGGRSASAYRSAQDGEEKT